MAYEMRISDWSSDVCSSDLVSWRIADGYYLYRHRISAEVVGGGFDGASLQLPRGARHTDEFFGEVETFRQHVQGVLPASAAAGADTVPLQVNYPGCADLGACFPTPQLGQATCRRRGWE